MKGVDTMPSSISFNGVRTFRPGVYAVIDASALGGSGVSTGNVAVIGDFALLPQNAPKSFSSARSMSDYFLGDPDMQLLAKIAFAPSTDDRVGGGASNLFLVNAGASTQASATFNDVDGTASLLVKSKLYGKAGNKVAIDLAQNANNTAYDISIRYNGIVESFSTVESGLILTAKFSGSGTASLVGDRSAVTLTEKFPAVAVNANAQEVDTAFSIPAPRNVTVKPSVAVGAEVSVTVEGTDSNGAAKTEIVTIPNGSDAAVSTTDKFASVTKCTVGPAAGANASVSFHCELLALDTADFTSVSDIADTLEAVPNMEVARVVTNTKSIPADYMDAFNHPDISNASGIRADLHALIEELKSSQIITADRLDVSVKKPAFSTGTLLGGGTQTSPNAANYTAGFQELLAEDVQIVVPMDDTTAIHQLALQHCKDSMLYGRERNAYVGAPAKTELAILFADFTRRLNSRHVALVGQSIKYSMPDGSTKTLAPKFLALMCACMQAGTSVSTPLTRKRPGILGIEQHSGWNPILNANEAIKKGILAISLDNLGLRIERSVTTYMEDDNPIFSEISANESVNTSVRTLRAKLDIQIGNPAVSGTKSQLENSVKVNLAQQVRDGVIKAFQNVSVDDLGDRFDISYEVAAVEPLNFIKITANVVRIPG